MSNHIATNIITRGNMNASALYKGFILPQFTYSIRTRRPGGSIGYYEGDNINKLNKDINDVKDKKEEIDVINVYINWNKNINKLNKDIYVKLVETEIKAVLISNGNDDNININVELID